MESNKINSNNFDNNSLNNSNVVTSSNNGDNQVVNIKDVPLQFNREVVDEKTNGVITRVNAMIRNNEQSEEGKKTVNGKKKVTIKCILSNRKFVVGVLLLGFIFTCVTVGKTFYLRNKVNNYDEIFTDIEEKQEKEMAIYQDTEYTDNSMNVGAASELVSCISSPLDIDNLPDNINSIIKEINEYYNQSNNYFAFKYKDIYTGFSISYNENQAIFAASTIKAPKDIYIYEMASLGNINLDDELIYTSNYYNTGTGILKNKEFDTNYSIRDLVEYSTVNSDNAAHNMLMDKYGKNNMLEFWKEKGTNVIFTGSDNWGSVSAHDASIYMEELYKFYLSNEEYGQELMGNFIDSITKFISGKNDYKVANKSGWSGSAIHDVSIVFADNPYIVVALSNLGNTDSYMDYFNKVNDFAYRLHTEYWKYKMDMCSDINQY